MNLPEFVIADLRVHFKLIDGCDDGEPAYAVMALKGINKIPENDLDWDELIGRMIQGIPYEKDKIITCSYKEYRENTDEEASEDE